MTAHKRHAALRDSGVTWLGEIPAHWDVVQSRRLFSDRNQSAFAGEAQLTVSQKYGLLPQTEFMELEGRRIVQVQKGHDILKHVEAGDFVISMRSFQGGLEYSTHTGSVSSAYVALTPIKWVEPRFFRHLFKSVTYVQALQSTSDLVRDGQALRFENFSKVALPVVPQEEQVAIADHLDRETVRIDNLIVRKTRFIELLAEKRQALVTHAVTKSLNPKAKMRDSGVEWLGQVPEHWTVCRVKHVVNSIEQGWSPQCESTPVESDDEWGVLKVGCVNGGTFDSSENKKLPDSLEPIAAYSLKEGDFLVSRANTRELVGSAAVVLKDHPNLMLCDKLYRLRLNNVKCQPKFLSAFLGTPHARQQIELEASGTSSSMLNISQSAILDLPVALPGIDEQNAIVEDIREKTKRIDTLVSKTERSIDLLREHRTALISAAVTGKIDLRDNV